MPNGFMGKVLWVNLSSKTLKEEELPNEIYRQYIGGYGLATKLIYENMPAKVDPLGAEALFGFFPGLLTGSVAPLSGRFMIAGKSPLTGGWGDANCGGYFGPEIKKCGFDAILIKGKADNPKYITIIDDKMQILDASDLWGLDCVQTEEKLEEKHGKVQVASIGQSGEKLSLISGIVNDKARIAARSGFGAVMGSKNLKALALKGNKKIELADKDILLDATKGYNEWVKGGASKNLSTLGTTFGNVVLAKAGSTPIKNWGGNVAENFPMERLQNISGETILKYKQKSYGCFSCPIQCGAILKIPEVGIEETHRPEYETCGAFGHMCLNDDLMSLFIVNDLCNRAGLDTISAGTTVAFAIECYENGVINKEDTDGLELTWGNSSVIIELTKKIINREGFGDILADGTKKAAEKIGKGSEQFAINAAGQEMGMHNPKFYQSLGLTYAFDPTPGRHTVPTLDMLGGGSMGRPDGLFKGLSLPRRFRKLGDDRYEAHKLIISVMQVANSLGLCQFICFLGRYPLFELIKGNTGWDLTMDDVIKIGIRIQSLRQAFSIREGINIINNKLPERATSSNYLEEFKGFCQKFGWNPENGYPLKETLTDLNLDFVLEDLY